MNEAGRKNFIAIRRRRFWAEKRLNAFVLAAFAIMFFGLCAVASLLQENVPAFAALVRAISPQAGAVLLLVLAIALTFAGVAWQGRRLIRLASGHMPLGVRR